MTIRLTHRALYAALLASALISTSAFADPPDRVARLSYESGTVTFEPAGTQDWVDATLNRPLVTGDSLWVDASSRAELNVGRAAVWADSQTSLGITNLDDRVAQFQLAQGTILVRVRSMGPDSVYEIDTPNLALTLNQPGLYRVTVTADGQTTYALVRQGAATASGDNQSYAIGAGQSYSFAGNDLNNYTYFDPPAPDAFDHFEADRDNRWEHSASARYVSPEMIGYEDLDANGSWQVVEGYGNVWVPNNVAPDWAPYHYGHWAWVSPWGWTWVDDAAWGFAPFHYGRWVQVGPGWGWIPGPIGLAPVYAPALVAFVGGPGFSVSVGVGPGIAWFPLGYNEVYRPGYEVSAAYVQRVNLTNTTVNTTIINNTTVVHYANQGVPNAVTAVPREAFASGQPVARAAVRLSPGAISAGQVSAVAAVAPTARALTGPGALASARPAAAVMMRPVVARTAPPPAPIPFAARQQALAANPGRPLSASSDEALRRSLPAAAAARPAPHMVAPTQAAIAPPARVGAAAARPASNPVQRPQQEFGARPQAPQPVRPDQQPLRTAPVPPADRSFQEPRAAAPAAPTVRPEGAMPPRPEPSQAQAPRRPANEKEEHKDEH